MLTLTNRESIDNMRKNSLFPAAFSLYLAAEFETLQTILHYDEAHPFSLEEHGYWMVAIESEDEYLHSQIAALNLNHMETVPEFVELIHLSSEISLYRACLMPDNECFVLVYAIVGSLRPSTEQWFVHHAGCHVREVVQ